MLKYHWIFLFAILLFTQTRSAMGQFNQHWRYWSSQEGLGESWCPAMTLGQNNNVWVTHGEFGLTSRLDGYKVHYIPSPDSGVPVYETRFGQIWSAFWIDRWDTAGGFQRYNPDEKRWIRYPVAELRSAVDRQPSKRIFFFPVAQNRLIFLLPDRLMEFNAVTQETSAIKKVQETKLQRFNHMLATQQGDLWITGEQGAAKVQAKAGIISPDSKWIEYLFEENLGIHNLRFPFEDTKGNLIGTAVTLDESKGIVIYLDGDSWKQLYQSDDTEIVGLPSTKNGIWVVKGPFRSFSFLHIDKNRQEEAPKNKILSGSVFNLEVETDGTLWIATSQGLARCSLPIWRTPTELIGFDKLCHAIYEDDRGRLWFVCLDTLLLYEKDRWKFYPLPENTMKYDSITICSLPNGCLAIRMDKLDEDRLLSFCPEKEEFIWIEHPEGRDIELIAPRKSGGIWLAAYKDSSFRLETFDGERFEVFLDMDDQWNIGEFRHFFEDENGELWFGGMGEEALGVYRKGVYRSLGSEYPGDSAFCIYKVDEGKIWFADRDSIFEFDGKNWTRIRSVFDPIPSMVKAQDGSVWVAGWSGVYRYHKGSWVSYSEEEGLPNAAPLEVFEDSQGRIWAGTSLGISLYHRDADLDPPQAYIVQEKNVKEIAPGGEAQLVYTGMDKWKYTEVDRLLYSHRIDEGAWSSFEEETVATHSGLKPGPHRFEVRAMDRNWNVSEPVFWEFEVLLPWYREPAFLAITTLSVILITLFIGIAINRHLHLCWSYETLRLTQNQLIQSEKMASLGQLVAGVAHEINNPLNFIKSNIRPMKDYLFGYKKVLDRIIERKDRFPEDMKKDLETWVEEEDLQFAGEDSIKLIHSLEDGSQRIARIVSDLRQYSRVDKDYYSPTDLHELINSTLNLLDNRYKRHVKVHKEYGDLPPVACSPGQMGQVFMNLLSNAEQAIEGEGNVWIRTWVEKEHVKVEIRDDGRGIAPELLTKIFDPFFTTKPVGSGTGLGLSISLGIVQQHGGEIMANSQPGPGASFTVILPMRSDSDIRKDE